MSYETNPILNRIKIAKGWKHSAFPTKTLTYPRDIRLWFKIYLFLKVYFWCQNIKLLTCELRTSERHTKIFYLSIHKYIPSPKKTKSKWKKKSFLQQLKSPLIKTKNKKARFLLYRDLNQLKKKSELFLNTQRKKKTSKRWLSKIRRHSWVNVSQDIFRQRKFYVKEQNRLWKKKEKISLLGPNKNNKPKIYPTSTKKNSCLQQAFLWKKAHRNIFRFLVKLQKQIFFLRKNLNFVWHQNFKTSTKACQLFFWHLKKQFQTSLKILECLQKLYQVSLQTEIKEKKQKIKKFPFFQKRDLMKTYLNKTNLQANNLLWVLKKQDALFQKQKFFFRQKKKNWTFLTQFEKNLYLKNFWQKKKNLILKKNQSLCNFYLVMHLAKIYFFKRPTKVRKRHVFKFLRFGQKQFSQLTKKLKTSFLKNKTKTLSKQINGHPQKFSYRLSFRYNYRNHLTLVTNIKLKYLIENLIQHYFSIFASVKLFWPVIQFKNLKFYRIVFPPYKQFKRKKKIFPLRLNKNSRRQKKRYLSLRQTTNHLKFQVKTSRAIRIGLLYKNLLKKKNVPVLSKTFKNQKVSISGPNVWQKKWEKQNIYLKLKKKVIISQSQNRLFFLSKQKFISNLITTLILFAKYLDPQPLADHLAKLIGDTKKHAAVFYFMKTILRTLHFKRGVGYRIALTGRINGRNKSRTFYLKKLNRSRSRQTFLKNVNFAMSQARATIGAFGIKIWVYS